MNEGVFNMATTARTSFPNRSGERPRAKRRTASAEQAGGLVASRRIKEFPLWFFLAYFIVTVLVFAFGPWPNDVDDPFAFYLFLAFAFSAFTIGYIQRARMPAARYIGRWDGPRLLTASIVTIMVLAVPTVYHAGNGSFDIVSAALNPGEAYQRAQERNLDATTGGGSLIGYFVVYIGALTAPLRALALPLTIVFRRRLKPRVLVFCLVVSSLLPLAVSIMLGTNKAVADLVLTVPWFIWLSFHYEGRRVTQKHLLTAGFAILALVVGFMLLLGRNIAARSGESDMGDFYAKLESTHHLKEGVWSLFPDTVKAAVVTAGGYGTQGYNGLAHSLAEPEFEWSYGAGHSLYLTSFVERWVGAGEISSRTYPHRIEQRTGWSARVRWHTIFPWLASDVTFFGVIPVMFLLGWLLAACWLDVVNGDNPVALGLLCYLLVMMFYIPGNNQVMQTFESYVGFWGCLILWAATRRRIASNQRWTAHQ
jgi:hypothetical protein